MSLDDDLRELPGVYTGFCHVTASPHGISRRHDHPVRGLEIIGPERDGTTADAGQLVDPDHEYCVGPARGDSGRRLAQCGSATRARVLDVSDWNPRHSQVALDSLSDQRTAVTAAAEGLVDVASTAVGLLDRC